MDEVFVIPVSYRDEELVFPARLNQFGFSYKIQVDIYGTMVDFEKDDEGLWRSIVSREDMERNTKVERSLLQSIAETLEQLLG